MAAPSAHQKLSEIFAWGIDAGAFYTLLKIELLTVPVLSENDSCSIPIERRMLRCTFDMRVSPLRQ